MGMLVNFLFNHTPPHTPRGKMGVTMCPSLTADNNNNNNTEKHHCWWKLRAHVEELELQWGPLAHSQPPIISSIDFFILVEVFLVGEIQ
ncbi:hypothetical protein ACTXT7_017363 [Hymenolepis weldensis]